MTERRRKIEKILVFSSPVLIILLLCGYVSCITKPHDYRFLFDPSEITAIEIVDLGEYNADTRLFEENVISVVEDHEAFLDDFRSLECRDRFTDPICVNEGGTYLKLTYSNGNYELIFRHGRGKYVKYEDGSDKFFSCGGNQSFGEEFEELIEKYS